MDFRICKDCAWCCVFVGAAGRRARPRLNAEDKRRLAGHGRVWDGENRLLTRDDGTCILYRPGHGCRLPRRRRPFDCLLYPFRRGRGGRYVLEAACPAAQKLLRRLVRENGGPLEADLAALARRHEATWAASRRIKEESEQASG